MAISFIDAYDIDSLISHLKHINVDPKIIKVIESINSDNYSKIVKALKKYGLTDQDENRIFQYKNGLFRFNNMASKMWTKKYDASKKYLTITNELLNNYKTPVSLSNNDGIIIPIFYDGRIISFLEDSEYYLLGYNVFATPNMYEGIQYLSNHRSEGTTIKHLLKYLDANINYVIDIENKIIYNITHNDILKSSPGSISEEVILQVMKTLDLINQPYPKGFLYENNKINPILINFINSPSVINVLNQVIGRDFRSGDAKIYKTLGLDNVCHIESMILIIENDKIIHNPTPEQLQNIIYINPYILFNRIKECNKDVVVIGLSLSIDKYKHQVVMILNTKNNVGYLFDPSYSISNQFIEIYNEINSLFKSQLGNNWSIKSNNNFGCPFLYSFQSDINDLYCISWSFYLSLLYILNFDKDFESIVDFLYKMGRDQIKVIIPRFIMFMFPGDIALLMEVEQMKL